MTSKQIPADLSARMSASIVLSRREMKSTRKSERGKGRRPAESREQKAERAVTGAGLIAHPMHAEATDCTAGWRLAGNRQRKTDAADTSLGKPVGESVTLIRGQRVGFNVNEFMAEARRCKGGDATEIRATDELGRWIGWS